jgi:hypothetical protein
MSDDDIYDLEENEEDDDEENNEDDEFLHIFSKLQTSHTNRSKQKMLL